MHSHTVMGTAAQYASRVQARVFFIVLIGLFSSAHSYGQQQSPGCKSPIEYGDKNKMTPEPFLIKKISGRVITEDEDAAKELGPIPACLGLFTEKDHRLVASATADRDGQFRFGHIPAGQYRLIVRDAQGEFCVANMPLRVRAWPGGNTKPLVIHMRPSDIDDCSYGAFK